MASVTCQLHLKSMNLPGVNNLRRAPVIRLPNSVIPFPGRATSRLRRYSITASVESGVEKCLFELVGLSGATSPSVVALLSYIPGLENREVPHSVRRGTEFFVDPTLIVTSARVVGTVSAVHNCFLARTIAVTSDAKVFCTRPAAVNFAGDVAVLEVLNPRERAGDLPPPLAVANAVADIDSPKLAIVRHENATALMVMMPGSRRQSIRPKAPWPLDDELEWIGYGAGERRDSVIVSLADICGSPWFNFEKEVVGMASWAAEEEDGRINGYSVPPICIKHMVGYAKTKGPHDPIILDRWINALTIADDTSDVAKECIPQWTRNVINQMFV